MSNAAMPTARSVQNCATGQSEGRQSQVEAFGPGTMLLETLRAFERHCTERGLLPLSQWTSPLWFIAETERNVFLWRRGCSLIQEAEFEFWFDVPQLIEKRRWQLESFDGSNPFGVSREGQDHERQYLEQLAQLIHQACDHMHALSYCFAELARAAESGIYESREVVLLPRPLPKLHTPHR